jgi:hypothetical protein
MISRSLEQACHPASYGTLPSSLPRPPPENWLNTSALKHLPFLNGLISMIVTAKGLHFPLIDLTCSLEHERAK